MFSNTITSHSLTFRGIVVKPGTYLKVSGIYGAVRYECMIHDLDTGKDYLLVHIGKEKRTIPIERLLDVVTKRSRRKIENG